MIDEPTPDSSSPPSASAIAIAVPWTIAGIMTVVAGLLGVQLVSANQQLAAARQTTAAPAKNAAPAAAPTSQEPQVTAVLKSLPRRQANDPLAVGRVDAPVVLIEWSDWRCPFCAAWAKETLPQLQPYVDSGSLRIEYRDLQIFGEESIAAARGARAAAQQGKFWEFYHAVWAAAPTSGHPTITDVEVLAFAKTAGVPDLARFTKDYADPKLLEAITADIAQARQIGLDSTPFFVVNTTAISGAQPAASFIKVIESYGGRA